MVVVGLEVGGKSRVAELRSSVAGEGTEADDAASGLEIVVADGDDSDVVEVIGFQSADHDGRFLVRGDLSHW